MSGGRKKARYSRASQLTSREMILIHRPTGVHVKGDIREGNYTRDEMRNFERELYQRLYILLENEVAKFLRVSGR